MSHMKDNSFFAGYNKKSEGRMSRDYLNDVSPKLAANMKRLSIFKVP